MPGFAPTFLLLASFGLGTIAAQTPAPAQPTAKIPSLQISALDGHAVVFPRDLSPVTVLILGFSRNSEPATTAWEKQVRTVFTAAPTSSYYDAAMLAEVPGLFRGFVLRSLRKKVPDFLKPRFLPLTQDEPAWKQAVGYTHDAPDAAYILLVDRTGAIRWSTHQPFTPAAFAELQRQAASLR